MDTQYLDTVNSIREYSGYQDTLAQLNKQWDSVWMIGAINQDLLHGEGLSLLHSMKETRDEFTALQGRLLRSLAEETVNKATGELTFFAQNAIDILIRNLYERTADVGFLATDSTVREFLSSDQTASEEIHARLYAYTQKYSVYDEIILLDSNQKIRANLDGQNTNLTPDGALIDRLHQSGAYLEYFGPTSLYPSRKKNHVFASTIYASDEERAPLIGYLVMFFRLEDELHRIIGRMLQPDSGVNLLLLDENNRIQASSEPYNFPTGTQVSGSDGCVDTPLRVNDDEMLSATCSTKGYQGYDGLTGWKVRAVKRVSDALNTEGHNDTGRGTDYTHEMSVLSKTLRRINQDSETINRKLRIVTVNGKSLAARLDARTFVPILENIQTVGDDIIKVISSSISTLNQTAVHSILSNCRLYSSLAIDVMDRNLYERANDCRWWALAPEFIKLIERIQDQKDSNAAYRISNILRYINELYTVYTNLIIYDHQGRILACSSEEEANTLIGTNYPEQRDVQAALMLKDSQQYVVSDFASTPLYANQHTYIYHSAIRNEKYHSIAGIGIVFDAAPEFLAMLEDALPRDAKGRTIAGAGGIYLDRNGQIISATNKLFEVGQEVPLPPEIASLAPGESYEGRGDLGGVPVLMGATASRGYREYKTTGDYVNDVIAIIYVDTTS